jgi:hypothetical protein
MKVLLDGVTLVDGTLRILFEDPDEERHNLSLDGVTLDGVAVVFGRKWEDDLSEEDEAMAYKRTVESLKKNSDALAAFAAILASMNEDSSFNGTALRFFADMAMRECGVDGPKLEKTDVLKEIGLDPKEDDDVSS